MNFLSMKYFSAVAKVKNFTKAAESLHITQQTLSAHIATLEKELGCKLFIRHSPLELTYAGKVFLRYANDFEKLYSSMDQEFSDIRTEERGVLRIGIAHTRGRAIMPDLIAAYQKTCPKIEIQIVEAKNDALPQLLFNGEIDLMIANLLDDVPEIQVKDFYEEEVVLLISTQLLHNLYQERTEKIINHIQTHRNIAPLSLCPFLLSSQEDIAGRIGNRIIAESAFTPQISAQSGNIETLLELCNRGVGACFCPEILMRKTFDKNKHLSIYLFRFGDAAKYKIKLGWLSQSYCPHTVKQFIAVALTSCEMCF